LDEYERTKLSDVLVTQTFYKGDLIIKEGDVADRFYLILTGEAEAIKQIGGRDQVVFWYNSQEGLKYFGELALLNNNKRNASIRVVSDEMQVVYLEKEAFENLIGNIRDILMRNQDQYEKFQKQLG
jgi:cAMP-dependent protein kinase regulator